MVLFALASPLQAAVGPGQDESVDGDGWVLVRKNEQLALYERRLPEVGIREGLGRMVVELPPRRLWRVLTDFNSFPEFVPYVLESRVMARHVDGVTLFQRLDLPWPMQDRYYTLRFWHTLPEEPGGRYVQRWDLAPLDERFACDCGVETPVNHGSWQLVPLEGGRRTLAIYHLVTDPGGRVPEFLLRFGNRRAIPRLFEAVYRRALDPRYTEPPSGAKIRQGGAPGEDQQ